MSRYSRHSGRYVGKGNRNGGHRPTSHADTAAASRATHAADICPRCGFLVSWRKDRTDFVRHKATDGETIHGGGKTIKAECRAVQVDD